MRKQAKKKEAAERDGRSRKIKGKKEKMVNTECSQMHQINRAFSGGGVKVSAATVSQDSDDTGPSRVTFPYCKSKHISGEIK